MVLQLNPEKSDNSLYKHDQIAHRSVFSLWNEPLCICILHCCTTIIYKGVKSLSEFWILFWWYWQGFCFNLALLHLCETFFFFTCWAGRSIQILTCTSMGQCSPNTMPKKYSSFFSEHHKVNHWHYSNIYI